MSTDPRNIAHRLGRNVLALLGWILVSGSGCSHSEEQRSPRSATQRTHSRASAARMYQMAEALVSEGRYAEGVRLIRHAILSLPRTEDADDTRHTLVVRMAYVQLLAAQSQQDAGYARDAARVLLRYGRHHESLFGDQRADERDAIYELLYEAETLAEALQANPESAVAPDSSDAEVVERSSSPPPLDTHAGEVLEAEINRSVRVRRGWFYDPDDPEIRRRLESWSSDAMGYDFMTEAGVAVLSGPRPMVRRSGPVRSVRLQRQHPPERWRVRRLGRQVLQESRPGLRECYRQAVARTGVLEADATLEFTVSGSGVVDDVVVADGGIIDGLGDACVVEHLAATNLKPSEARPAVRVQLSLKFFHTGADTKYEGDELIELSEPEPIVQHPGVDDFASPAN